MLLVFVLTTYLDGQPQPNPSYWQSLTRCQFFAQTLRRSNYLPHDSTKFNQPTIGATCQPTFVDPKTTRIWK